MYEEKKVRFSWKSFIIKFIILVLIVVLVFMLLPLGNKKEANGHSKVFNDNFNSLKEVGNSYFTKDTLPDDNEDVKITLRQLINSKKIKTLKGADKKVCNEDTSYIKSYKKNIGYELEVHLECTDETETSYIYLGCFDNCSINPSSSTTKTTSSTKTTKTTKVTKKANSASTTRKTTKATTTTTRVKKYTVIFNENGGSKINTQYIIENNIVRKPANPTRDGYTFIGWFTESDTLYDFNSPVNNNIILIAKWKINAELGY